MKEESFIVDIRKIFSHKETQAVEEVALRCCIIFVHKGFPYASGQSLEQPNLISDVRLL